MNELRFTAKELPYAYTAQGGERYLYIGNFRDSLDTLCEILAPPVTKTYILIDNVQLYECDSLIGIDENLKENIKIYPNPGTRLCKY